MLALVCLLLSGFVAFQTKPKQETFVPFLTTERKSLASLSSPSSAPSASSSSSRGGGGGGISGWFSRNILEPLGAAPRVPEHTITDYLFFHIAKLNDGSGLYLGMFQQWWVISELQLESGTSTAGRSGSGGNAHEAQAEAKKQEATQAKIKKDYHGAAARYVEAAKLFEKSGTQFNLMEAAGAYEDAFKAYNMAKQHEPAIRCLENAARLFRSNDRGSSRAAKLYSQLGDLIKAQDGKRAAELYGEAAELYASDGDGRALHSTIRQAEQLCVIHNYERAYTLYVDTIIPQTLSQDILQYTTRDHILNAIIAHLGVTKGDWIVFERDVEHFESMCVDFHTSRARDVLKSLAKAERDHDPEAFRTACQEFNRLSSTGMQDWQVALLLDEKRKLEDSSLL